MILNGYIIPDSVNRELASVNRAFGNTQILFGLEVADSQEQFAANLRKPKSKKISSVQAADSTNVTIQQTVGVSQESVDYVNTNIQKVGTFVNNTTITFNSGWLTAPAGLPPTSLDNFTIFCNGLALEKSAITSFTQSSGVTTMVISIAALGYGFDNTDEIIAIGKFSS